MRLLTTICLGLLFLLAFSTTGVAAQEATEISNVQELQNMEEDLDGDYVLVGDINASGVDFEPISKEDNVNTSKALTSDTDRFELGVEAGEYFTGSFDGNGHTISNLQIDRPNESSVGLFIIIMMILYR